MEVITIESKAFKQLMKKLDVLSDYVNSLKSKAENEDESWVDSHQISQVKKLLRENLIKSNEECFQELVEHHTHDRFNRNAKQYYDR